MKNFKRYLIVLLVLIAGSLYSGENLLLNSGFEETGKQAEKTLKFWQTAGGNVFKLNDKEKYAGNYSVKFWWTGKIYQTVDAIPGNEYKLKIRVINSTFEPLASNGDKSARVKLQFLTAGKELIYETASDPINKELEPGKWRTVSLKAVSPPNTSLVNAVFDFSGGKGKGVICIDSAELSIDRKLNLTGKSYALDLEGEWSFTKRDDPDFADPKNNDSEWEKIKVPGLWQEKYPYYNGWAWYRYNFKIPQKVDGEYLFLLIGNIKDADETYLNGQLIGRTGAFPPHDQITRETLRLYEIPPELVKPENNNLLSIRVYNKDAEGGITNRPVKIFNWQGLASYLNHVKDRGRELGVTLSKEEMGKFNDIKALRKPSRLGRIKLPNGGWSFTQKGVAFMPIGIEYEPLAMYGSMKWDAVKRDFELIKKTGFNTITVWCMDFNASSGAGERLTLVEMTRLAELARDNNIFIQFYLNIDRFIHLFPRANLPNGSKHGFDIDYYNPEYRGFIRNFAQRLAMALYEYDNVSAIVVWEEKIGLDVRTANGKFYVTALFSSEWGRNAFAKWLEKRHGNIESLNRKWGTDYQNFEEAVSKTLQEYYQGVGVDDNRQYDVLEFGQIMLIDFTKDFVDSYKAIDPTMGFQCRNYDLFGPIRALHPDYAFLDSYGVNNYSAGNRGHDISFRDEVVKIKLVAGVTGTMPYVSNYGFRTISFDHGIHGLVPNDQIKASMAIDSLSLFSFLPETGGSSYFMYYYNGREGQWGIINNLKTAATLPIAEAFKNLNGIFAQCNSYVAATDYLKKPEVYIFHGMDAIFDIDQQTWLEHTDLSYSLTEMNINYTVISDHDKFDPSIQPMIIANFHAYDKKIDSATAGRLLDYAEAGGVLVIGDCFGKYDRYLWTDNSLTKRLNQIKGIKTGDIKSSKLKVLLPKKSGVTEVAADNAWYVEPDGDLPADARTILGIEVNGHKQPGLICRPYGKGLIYYFLFNPYCHKWWSDMPGSFNRISLPVLEVVFSETGISHDTKYGNRGFALKNGEINIHEQQIHYFINRESHDAGMYADIYGLDSQRYSGGVITDKFISFRGDHLKAFGWEIESSAVSSIYAYTDGAELVYFTTDPVSLKVKKDKWQLNKKTEGYKLYPKKN